MQIKVKLDGAVIPKKAYEADAGFDLLSRESITIFPHFSHTFDTGVHFEIPRGYVGFLKSKSGLNVRHSILNEGVIDSGFTGSIKVKLYNHGNVDYHIDKGDKISQIVFLPIPEVQLVEVDSLEDTDRGSNGIGSTGR